MKSKKLRHLPVAGLLISSLAFSVSSFAQSSIALGPSTCVDDGTTVIDVPISFTNGDNISSYSFNLTAGPAVTFVGCVNSVASHIPACAVNGVGFGVGGFSIGASPLPAGPSDIVTVQVTVANGAGCPQAVNIDLAGPPAATFGDTGNIDITVGVTNNLTTDDSNGIGGPPAAAGYSSVPAPGGTITVGSSTIGAPVSATLQVSETGTGQLNVTAGTIGGANAGDFTVTPTTFNITDGGTAQAVTVTCTPGALGARAGTLTFTTNDPAQATVNYTLACTGVDVPPAQLSVAPAAIDFGDVAIGQMPTQTVTVTNSAPAGSADITALTISPPSVVGSAFSILTDNCNGLVTLTPGGPGCDIVIQFAPLVEGPAAADTIMVDAGLVGNATVNLSGNGVLIVIPTMSEWAMMIMAALMLLFGVVTLRRNGYLS